MPEAEEVVDITNSVSMEDMERQQTEAPPPAKPADIKLEGDSAPEADRGKSVADIIAQRDAMASSLRLSESARIALEQATLNRAETQPVQAQQVQQQPGITREQLQEMYERDPLEAIATINQLAIDNAARQYDVRMAQLTQGSSDSMESWARQNYPKEFETIGKEITGFVNSLPDKSIFASKKGWEDAVSYVRGLPGNFEKVMDARQAGTQQRSREVARQEQIADVGFSTTGSQRAPLRMPAGELDPTSKKIADEFIRSGVVKDYAEYIKWRDIA